MTLPEFITAVKDIFVGLAAIFATFFAYLGLTAWREELKGKAEYQLAKEVLKSVYKVRDAFEHVRNPAIYQFEYPKDMLDHQGYLKQEHEYEGTMYIYEKRWAKMSEAFRELEEHHLDAQVEWGSEFQNVIMKLRSCNTNLLVTIQQFLERKKHPRDFEPANAEKLAEERSILYQHEKNDIFSREIQEAIKAFEDWLRPHIKSQY